MLGAPFGELIVGAALLLPLIVIGLIIFKKQREKRIVRMRVERVLHRPK